MMFMKEEKVAKMAKELAKYAVENGKVVELAKDVLKYAHLAGVMSGFAVAFVVATGVVAYKVRKNNAQQRFANVNLYAAHKDTSQAENAKKGA